MEQYAEENFKQNLSEKELEELEERRIEHLNKAGIDEDKVIHEAREDDGNWETYFQENITRGKSDMDFVYKDQWSNYEREEFGRTFKPCLQFNKIYPETKKIIGEQRKNKPELIVRSLTGKATQADLDLRSDIVRTIAYQSQNDLVYQIAFKSALSMGYGAFQVLIDYESPRSFKKVIRYDAITDATLCSWDIKAKKPHKGDGNFCSRRYIMSLDEFYASFPFITNPISYPDPRLVANFQYQAKDYMVINDHFKKEWFPLIIYQLSNGDVVTQEEWKEREKSFEDLKEFTKDTITGEIISRDIPKIISERQTQDYKIMHYRLLQNQIIDFTEWPSRQLPIPFVDGDSYFIEGRQYTKSYVHEGRDAQKLLNYSLCEVAAELKNRRREQWLATPDNISGYEQQWRNPETQMGALIARPDPKTAMMPQKMPAWDVSQGLFVTAQTTSQYLKEILGDTESEELRGRDVSGKARRERKLETSMSSYVFFDNLNEAIEQGGRIVNDLLPYIFGSDEHHLTVTRKNGKTESLVINQKQNDKIVNQVIQGDFDVEIDAGPSFAVQKEMALEFLQQTLQAFPQAFPLIADLWAKNLDVQFMPQMAERFKTIVPPEIIAKEEGKPPPTPQPNPQQQMMQMEMQARQQELMERAKEIQIRESKNEIEKAELMLKAHEMGMKNVREDRAHQTELAKADMDFSAKIAKILSDTHKKQ